MRHSRHGRPTDLAPHKRESTSSLQQPPPSSSLQQLADHDEDRLEIAAPRAHVRALCRALAARVGAGQQVDQGTRASTGFRYTKSHARTCTSTHTRTHKHTHTTTSKQTTCSALCARQACPETRAHTPNIHESRHVRLGSVVCIAMWVCGYVAVAMAAPVQRRSGRHPTHRRVGRQARETSPTQPAQANAS